jgi:3-oxoacyl-[acyl-carrier protein] reductase/meso-butanediol dehydrogenase/(S,S)-butanediol dehydrogenase/diacetyl reductase
MRRQAKRRVVAVTGGTRGIGRAIAELFLSRGDAVAVGSRSAGSKGMPEGVYRADIDVRRREEMRRFIRGVVTRFGRLDVLVNCAGVSRWKPVEAIDDAFAAELLETIALGTMWGCAEAAAVLPRGGSIVNVSSLAGKRGSANNSAYCAAKFAVNGITQSLAKELGPRGIRVNAVCPVYVRTEAILSALKDPDSPAQGEPAAKYLASFARTQTALGRLPTAGEVAEAVYFLAGSSASAITGQCLNVDCGTLPQ